MKNLSITIILAILTISSFAQTKLKGNKKVITQNREVEYFNKIVVKDDLKVIFSNGTRAEVSVETDENLQDAITTRSEGGTLDIYISQPIATSKQLMVYVSVVDTLLTIETRDKASITSENEIITNQLNLMSFDKSNQKMICHANKINIEAEGSSDMELTLIADEATNIKAEGNSNLKLNLKTNSFDCFIQNSASVKPVGNAKTININSNDNGNYSGKEMLAESIVLEALDKSEVSVNASKNLEIEAQNDVKVYIYSNPKILLKKFTDKAVLFKK
jgi:uncharacterized lipoprotein YbaY